MASCRHKYPPNGPVPRSCPICQLGPCRYVSAINSPLPAEQQQRLPNQEPFTSVAQPGHPTAPALPLSSDEQRKQASIAVNEEMGAQLTKRFHDLLIEGADGRCISLAKTKLEEAIMWANRGVFAKKPTGSPGPL